MTKTFASYSFGCRVNQAEKEKFDTELSTLGFQYLEDNPTFYIINSCAVTAKAEREVRQKIYQIKRKFPKTKIIVTGCAATRWIKDGEKVEGVDRMVGNKKKANLAKLIFQKRLEIKDQKSKQNLKLRSFSSKLGSDLCFLNSSLYQDKFVGSKRLFIKIQDGCQRFCTYCIVPYLRGKPKSVKIKDIVKHVKSVEKNISEVILSAINTEAFGIDTGEKLTDLITEILEKTNIQRLSFGSIHPWSIEDEFLSLYKKLAADNRFSHFFHIPIQSGSNKILKLMKRNYTTGEILEKLTAIKKINPMAFIGTDIIAGFLDETDKDFAETFNFLKTAPIDRFHIFRFSKRINTAAFFMSKNLKEPNPKIKEKRSKALIELGNQKYRLFLLKHLGKTFPALFLERRKNGYQQALLNNQIPILVKKGVDKKYKIEEVIVKEYVNKSLIALSFKYT